jgi:hypothetical protein
MLIRAGLVWIEMLVLAIANGAARESLLVPRLGTTTAHVISTLVLSVLIFIAGSLAMPWIAPASLRDAWTIGVVWVLLTLAFEFLAGHFIFGRPWKVLLADYDLAAGRIWILVLIVTLITPVVAFNRARGGQSAQATAATHR